jgi:hypothetical protein
MQTELAQAQAATLSPAGWILMILSVGFVTVLVVWCFKRVLSLPAEEKDTVKDLHSA